VGGGDAGEEAAAQGENKERWRLERREEREKGLNPKTFLVIYTHTHTIY
jgi:hypothetical protein